LTKGLSAWATKRLRRMDDERRLTPLRCELHRFEARSASGACEWLVPRSADTEAWAHLPAPGSAVTVERTLCEDCRMLRKLVAE
jgi:hypothetical protein